MTLTEELKEHGMKCRGRAERARAAGDEEAARKWTERAKHADQGFMLADHADVKYQFEHQDLMSKAAKESRLRHVGLPERQRERMERDRMEHPEP